MTYYMFTYSVVAKISRLDSEAVKNKKKAAAEDIRKAIGNYKYDDWEKSENVDTTFICYSDKILSNDGCKKEIKTTLHEVLKDLKDECNLADIYIVAHYDGRHNEPLQFECFYSK